MRIFHFLMVHFAYAWGLNCFWDLVQKYGSTFGISFYYNQEYFAYDVRSYDYVEDEWLKYIAVRLPTGKRVPEEFIDRFIDKIDFSLFVYHDLVPEASMEKYYDYYRSGKQARLLYWDHYNDDFLINNPEKVYWPNMVPVSDRVVENCFNYIEWDNIHGALGKKECLDFVLRHLDYHNKKSVAYIMHNYVVDWSSVNTKRHAITLYQNGFISLKRFNELISGTELHLNTLGPYKKYVVKKGMKYIFKTSNPIF